MGKKMVAGVALMIVLLVSYSSADDALFRARHRRQSIDSTGSPPVNPGSTDTLPFSSAVQCPIRCILSLSQAWAKTFSFDIPSTNMLGDRNIIGSNDTLMIMCSLYATYTTCLKGCDVANAENRAVLDVVPPYTKLCTDNIHEIEDLSPCLSDHTITFQGACQSENENALASASRMINQAQLNDKLLDDYCGASKAQLYCLFPAIRQTCGDQPYELIRAMANASFTSIRVSIGDSMLQKVFPECKSFFVALDQGIGVSSSNLSLASGNATTDVQSTTSTATFNTTSTTARPTSSTTQVILKDEADPYDGSEVQTTTPSSASKMGLSVSTIVTLAIALLIF